MVDYVYSAQKAIIDIDKTFIELEFPLSRDYKRIYKKIKRIIKKEKRIKREKF